MSPQSQLYSECPFPGSLGAFQPLEQKHFAIVAGCPLVGSRSLCEELKRALENSATPNFLYPEQTLIQMHSLQINTPRWLGTV
jgi:hypothetical protein